MAAPVTIAARSAPGASLTARASVDDGAVRPVVARLVVDRELNPLCCCTRPRTLTGLGNRNLFSDQVDAALFSDVPLAVLVLDLDDFKLVNDSPATLPATRAAGRRRALVEPAATCDAVARLGTSSPCWSAGPIRRRVPRLPSEPWR